VTNKVQVLITLAVCFVFMLGYFAGKMEKR
jgi:hypothetical protein